MAISIPHGKLQAGCMAWPFVIMLDLIVYNEDDGSALIQHNP